MSLVDLTTIKDYLLISGETYDTQLELYLDIIIGEIEAYTGRVFEQQLYTDEVLTYDISRFDGRVYQDVAINYGNPTLIVKHYPILQASGFVLEYDEDVIDVDNYNLDYEAGIVYVMAGITDNGRRLTATYTAGYTSETLPPAILGIILEGIKMMFMQGGSTSAGSANVSSKSVKNFSVTYRDTTSSSSSSNVKSYLSLNQSVLDRYTRVI